jgi:hypothetical protein
MSPVVRLHLKKLILWAAPLAGLACGGDGGTDVVLPSLRVTTATTGVELDPDGYAVSVDGHVPQPIGSNATSTVDRLAEGQHTVELSGISGNCAVGGENPRSVGVTPGATTTVAFTITCSPVGGSVGSIQVVTTTIGSGTDPDGFALLLDGIDQGPIGVSATSSIGGLTPGSHTIGLTGLAANCQVSGDNPHTVTVLGGGTAQVAFAITCTAPGPTTGNLEIATVTTGPAQDADGYQVSVDGAPSQPIGTNATVTVANVSAAQHSVQLLGLAANCSVTGTNPLQATVPAGGTARLAFAVACTPTGPTTGTLEIATVTSGPSQDPDGYLVSIDGGTNQPIGTSATVRLTNVTAAQHTVELLGLAANCGVTGDNPLGVAVEPGETARVSFAVTCAATAGSLRVIIEGLPAGAAGAVTVTGPGNFSQVVTETRTLSPLTPQTYTVSAADVVSGSTTYTPSVSRPSVLVAAGTTERVTVSYTPAVVVPTLNLRIDGFYLTQSTQTYASGVPLVAGRAGYLRVFVLANESNTARPTVRVRFRNGSSTTTRTINAPGGSTPTTVQEGVLGSSWNLPVEAALIRPGLSIEATVDPGGSIAESNESDNQTTKTLTFPTAAPAPARIRFVSVQQGSSAAGNVSNPDELMAVARRMHPLNAIEVDVHSTVFTASAPLLPGTNGDGDGWSQLVSDLDGLRVAEGSNRTYFGIVKLTYGRSDGLVGIAFQERPTAVGWDDPADASRVVAHELGHTWGRRHSPCGNPPPGTIDGQYPHTGGTIGVFGFDVAAGRLKERSVPDIMGYCVNPAPWISDYTYRAVMAFRQANPGSVVASAVPQPSLLIWGRIVNGRPVLEPAFEVVTRPNLPSRPGPYSVSATGVDGSRLFTLSFDVAAVEDQAAGNGHFAFAVPLGQASASRLASLRLEGPTGGASSSRPLAQLRTGPASESIVLRRAGENVSIRWNAAAHPMIMVRDPDTGEVLSFARGGTALVRTAKDQLDLDVSDGVRSQRVRLAISRS